MNSDHYGKATFYGIYPTKNLNDGTGISIVVKRSDWYQYIGLTTSEDNYPSTRRWKLQNSMMGAPTSAGINIPDINALYQAPGKIVSGNNKISFVPDDTEAFPLGGDEAFVTMEPTPEGAVTIFCKGQKYTIEVPPSKWEQYRTQFPEYETIGLSEYYDEYNRIVTKFPNVFFQGLCFESYPGYRTFVCPKKDSEGIKGMIAELHTLKMKQKHAPPMFRPFVDGEAVMMGQATVTEEKRCLLM